MITRKRNSKITQAELDGDIFIGVELTPEEKVIAARQLAEARGKSEWTEEDRQWMVRHRLRMQIEDYLKDEKYNPALTFGYFLKEYADQQRIKRKDFAKQLSIDESLLSQLINGHRLPPDYLTIRLEIHSENMIPAMFWYKLTMREQEHYIKTDQELRRKQRKYVRIPQQGGQGELASERGKRSKGRQKPQASGRAGGKSRGISVKR